MPAFTVEAQKPSEIMDGVAITDRSSEAVREETQDLCRQLTDNDPRCRRVSLTSCYMHGTFEDSFCHQIATSLTDNRFVSELVVASPPVQPGPGAHALAAWVTRGYSLKKITLYAHNGLSSPSMEERDAPLPETNLAFTSFTNLFLSSSSRLASLDLRLDDMNLTSLVVVLRDVLVSTSSIQQLRLGFSERTEDKKTQASLAADDCRSVTEGLTRNSSLTTVVLLRVPIKLTKSCLDGLNAHRKVMSLTIDGAGSSAEVANMLGSFLTATTSLKHLCLKMAKVSPVLWRGLADNSSLDHLEMDSIVLEDGIPVQLQHNTTIERLHLSHTPIDRESLEGLIPALVRMRVASLAHCSLDDRIERLQPILASRNLVSLDLSGNSLGEHDGIRQIVGGLAGNDSMQDLDLSSCHLGDEKVAILVDSLQLPSLKSMNVAYNQVATIGARALARFVRVHTSLQVLDASCNSIQDEGTASLAEALVDSPLHELNLSDCEIHDKGLASLARALKHRTINTCLRVDGNRFTSTGYRSLNEHLPIITCLHELSIDLPNESVTCMEAFASSVLQNRSLRAFHQIQQDLENDDVHHSAIDFAVCRNRMFSLIEMQNLRTTIWPTAIAWVNRKAIQRDSSCSAIFCTVRKTIAGIAEEQQVASKRKLFDFPAEAG